MRIVTRPDLDGIVCAVLLFEVEKINEPIKWVSLNEVQNGLIGIKNGDIIANLPYHEKCSLWFDHHVTNMIDTPYNGVFKLAPSAAGIIYEYYKEKFRKDFSELVNETDKIDSANLSHDEIIHPKKYPYLLLAMTISRDIKDELYWNHIINLLRKYDILTILEDNEVKTRYNHAIKRNIEYEHLIKKHTYQKEHISISDFRELKTIPSGNRFLVHALFPKTFVNVAIGNDKEIKNNVVIKLSQNILNPNCKINLGILASKYNGGGHPGASSFRCHKNSADEYLKYIISLLIKNKPIKII